MVTITGEYLGQLHCTAVHGPSGRVIDTDAPRDNQGRGEAFSPTDLLATAYATCIATTLAIAARKHGDIDLSGISYTVTKEMTSSGPRKVERLHVTLALPPSARALPEGFLERVAHGCPVHLSLAPDVEKKVDFTWK